jgi:hypothetical protein
VQVIGGSRPRVTITHQKTKQRYLLKFSRHRSAEIFSELLASKLAAVANVTCQEVTIKEIPKGMFKNLKKHISSDDESVLLPIATLARNIFPKDYEITYGQRIVDTPSDPLTLEQIEQCLSRRYYAPEDLLDKFAEMIVFDAWIGNMDRHHENWGVSEHITIRTGQRVIDPQVLKHKRHFSPLYDHGSSLLFELDENKVTRYLQNLDGFKESYILGKSYTLIKDSDNTQRNVFEVIASHIERDTIWGRRFSKQIPKITSVQALTIATEVIKMPHHELLDYSDQRRELLYYSLVTRQQLLKEIVNGSISFSSEE